MTRGTVAEAGPGKSRTGNLPGIAFVWENFGPQHHDRCEAAALHFLGTRTVTGIEICSVSKVYKWASPSSTNYTKITLFDNGYVRRARGLVRIFKTVSACLRMKARHVFVCHYEEVATFIVAVVLRCLGRRVYVMNDSKFDDYDRNLLREIGKAIFYFPYCGAVVGTARSRNYLRFLGMRPARIELGYNSLSVARIQKYADADAGHPPYRRRHFSIVARMVKKKNLSTAIEAYSRYRALDDRPRDLHLYGDGILEAALKEQVRKENISDVVHFHGFLQSDMICEALSSTLALLLPSTEEQFGFAALEALAAGVPVILSTNCGVRDEHIRTGVNGFIVEPSNAEGMAFFMHLLATDEALWLRMRSAALESAIRGDAVRFANAVDNLIGRADLS